MRETPWRTVERLPLNPSSAGSFFSLLMGKSLPRLDADNPILFEDAAGSEKPFAPYYQQHIWPHVWQFEQQRLEALTTLQHRARIAVPVIAAIAVAVLSISLFGPADASASDPLTPVIYLGMVVGAIFVTWAGQPVRQYKSKIKSIIYPRVFSFFGENFRYTETSQMHVGSLTPSDIIPDFDTEHTEDYVRGSYKDVEIELTEACMTKTTGSGKNRRTVEVFRGIFILLCMNKRFLGKTVVKKDMGAVGNWFTGTLGGRLENVTLEDPVFEKKFEVYANNQVEARYLLTTSFMERLLKLSDLFRSSGIQCSFYHNRLLLMIPSRQNRFETTSIFAPATFVQDIQSILEEMGTIFQVIDILKLNEKTGL